jgi:hypothetical protein
MKKALQFFGNAVVAFLLATGGVWLWLGSISGENDLARPNEGPYEIAVGAVNGGPSPRADGYVVSSDGVARGTVGRADGRLGGQGGSHAL